MGVSITKLVKEEPAAWSAPDRGVLDLSSAEAVAEVLENFGRSILLCRLMRGLSLRAMAAACGVNYSTLSRAERGQGVGHRTAGKILRWMGTPAQESAVASSAPSGGPSPHTPLV